MRIAKLAAAAAALAMVASPAFAAAQNSAAKLSVASAKSVRAGSQLKDSSKVAPVVGVIAVIVALAGVGFATDVFGGDDEPDSQ